MKKLLSALTLCSCIIGGTVGTAVASDDNTAKILQSVNDTWNSTFNSGDSRALAQLYTKNATLSPGNGEVLVGQENIGNLFESFITNGVHNHSIETLEFYHSNKQIVQIGRWQADGVNEKQENISFGGVLMTVIEQNADGKWIIRSHVWNMGQ
jgi:uncharacterized protein (TIGR02246 family)